MKIKIHIDRDSAIAAGNELYGDQIVDIPLSNLPQDVRAELGKLYEDGNGVTNTTTMVDGMSSQNDPSGPIRSVANADTIIAILRHRSVVRTARAEAESRRIEGKAMKRKKVISNALEYLSANRSVLIEHVKARAYCRESAEYILYRTPGIDIEDTDTSREILKLMPELLADIEAGKAITATEHEQENKKIEAGKTALRTWAEQHSSDRVKLMLELDAGDWQKIAQREYTNTHAPEGYTYGSPGSDVRKRPTITELTELKRLRDLCAASSGVLSDPELYWVVQESEYDEDTGDYSEERRYCTAEVRVHSPDGKSDLYDREIESLEPGE